MSALGQKQTYAVQKAMSALPPIATAKADMLQMVMSALAPKADVCAANHHVCFGPIADMVLVDHHIGSNVQLGWYDKPQKICGVIVYDKLKFLSQLNWNVNWCFNCEYSI